MSMLFACFVAAFISPAVAENLTVAEVLKPAELGDRYVFELKCARDPFSVKCTYGTIKGDGVNEEQLVEYLKVFLPEIKLYPSQCFQKAKVRNIILCNGLKFDGQKRSAIPDWENDTLYYDVVYWEPVEYKQLVIHHELFHMVDVHDDGRLYQDDAWKRLLPETFKYGNGGRNAMGDKTMSLLTDDVSGFVTKYSTTGVEEDKAETFAHMILHPRYLAKRAQSEGLLEAKMFQTKRLLKQFCPEMGDDFWKQAASISRPDDMN
ncbi:MULTISPECIES: hypothetical protein [Pirellulaceae]|nr:MULTISPECIES: hypothetical protein [Pirellulaceae]